jgi:putative DNA primase/helicase
MTKVATFDASQSDWPALETEPASVFPCTDSGNAEYFAALHGLDARFDFRRGGWALWGGHKWQRDVDAEIRRLAKATIRQRLLDAATVDNSDERAKLAKWAVTSESRTRIEAMLYLAQAERPIADAGDRWDADPMLLGTPSGIADLRTGQLRPGRREDRITMNAAVPYEPDAACQRWEEFLSEVFNGDNDLIDFVWRAIGYSLTGATTEQCLFLCYGTGANGKSTLMQTLAYMLGDYGYTMPFATLDFYQRSAIPNDLAALVGRRFVCASETNDGTRLNESRVKNLTGCETITARFLHAEYFTFQPVGKFWLSFNHKPIVRDDSHAFWRRIRLIPFTQTFPINQTLAADLRAEASGILAWCVRGCLAWQTEGLNPPAVVTEATEAYERDSDQFAGFVAEALNLDQADSGIQAQDFYGAYSHWADGHGLTIKERLTATAFGRKASERFPFTHVNGRKIYQGIARRPPEQQKGEDS